MIWGFTMKAEHVQSRQPTVEPPVVSARSEHSWCGTYAAMSADTKASDDIHRKRLGDTITKAVAEKAARVAKAKQKPQTVTVEIPKSGPYGVHDLIRDIYADMDKLANHDGSPR